MLLLPLMSSAMALPAPEAAARVPRHLRLHGGDAPTLDADVYSRAEAGEVVTGLQFVDGVAAGRAWAAAVFDVPIEAVWMAINDGEAHPGRVGNLEASDVVRGDAHAHGRLVFQRLDLPILSDRWWVAEQHHNAAMYQATGGTVWEMGAWTRDSDEARAFAGARADGAVPVDWSRAGWLLVSLEDGRTLAEYWVWTDPGGSIPAGPASRFAPGALKRWMADMEAFAITQQGQDRSGFVRPDQTAL